MGCNASRHEYSGKEEHSAKSSKRSRVSRRSTLRTVIDDSSRRHVVMVTKIKYEPGIEEKVLQHLDRNQPILLPLPSPLPYIVVARQQKVVNGVKGRPTDQAVARVISSFDEIEEFLDLNYRGKFNAKKCLLLERMTVLLPVKETYLKGECLDTDEAREPSVEERVGFKQSSKTIRSAALKMDLSRREDACYCLFHNSIPLRGNDKLCSQENPLFGSSSNVSGHSYQQSLDKIIEQFVCHARPDDNYHLLALDAESLRTQGEESFHESTSMVQVCPTGQIKVTRNGIHHHPLYADSKSWRIKNEEEYEPWRLQ